MNDFDLAPSNVNMEMTSQRVNEEEVKEEEEEEEEEEDAQVQTKPTDQE
jgi:hypothetical protein